MRMKRYTTPWFAIGLGLYALALLAAIFTALNIVTKKLAAYEGSLASYAAEAVFNEYFSSGAQKAIESYAVCESEYDTKESVARLLSKLIEGKTLRYFETTVIDGVHSYAVAFDDTRFATFSLSPAKEEGKWMLNGIAFTVKAEQSVSVTARSDSTVFLNGKEVPRTAAGEKTEHFTTAFLRVNSESEPLCEGISFVTYTVDGLYGLPEVTVTDRRGRACAVTGGDGVYEETLLYDDDRNEEMRGVIFTAAEEYCKYMHRTTEYAEMADYMDSSCDFYKNLRKTSINWNLKIRTYDFVTEELCELYFYSDDVFSCWISIDENVVPEKTGRKETYELDCRLFFRQTEKGWRIFNVSFAKDS